MEEDQKIVKGFALDDEEKLKWYYYFGYFIGKIQK